MSKKYASRDFTDEGTGRSFRRGDDLSELDAGTRYNYQHAGLASDGKPKSEKAADTAPVASKPV